MSKINRKLLEIFIMVLVAMFTYNCLTLLNKNQKEINSQFSLRSQPPNVESLFSSMVSIETKGIAVTIDEDEKTIEIAGTGIHLGNGYIISLTHCTELPRFSRNRLPFGELIIPVEIIEEKYYIGEKEIKLIGREGEISLFQTDNPPVTSMSFSNDKEIKMGREVIMLCNALSKCFGIRIVNIYSNEIGEGGLYPLDDWKNVFSMHGSAINGSSGSPVIIYTKDNEIKILGITGSFLRGNEISFAFKPSYIKECIYKINEKVFNELIQKNKVISPTS